MEGHGFTWVSIIPGLNAVPGYTATAALVGIGLLVWGVMARRQLAAAPDAVVPDGTLTARNSLEIFVEYFSGLVDDVVGRHGHRYMPFYAALFLFILVSNLCGVIPGFESPTSNVNVTLGLGVLSFLVYNYYGFQAHGAGYLKHFLGPVWWLAVLMVPLELINNLLRPITLNLRLMMNLFADHLVLEIFTDLTRLVVPILFLALGAFVGIVQTFVFVILSLVYVSLAVHEH